MRGQLLERHPPHRRMSPRTQLSQIGIGGRRMQFPQGLRQIGQPQQRQGGFRDELGQSFTRKPRQCLPNQRLDTSLAQPFHSCVDGSQLVRDGRRRIRLQPQAVAGVHHFRPQQPWTHLTIGTHPNTGAKLLGLCSLEVEKPQPQGTVGITYPTQQNTTATLVLFHSVDAPFDQCRLARTQMAQRPKLGAILVTQRQMQQQIDHAPDLQTRQTPAQLLAHALQRGQRQLIQCATGQDGGQGDYLTGPKWRPSPPAHRAAERPLPAPREQGKVA